MILGGRCLDVVVVKVGATPPASPPVPRRVIRRRRATRRGFSIVEVTVCAGLLAVGLMVTLAASLSSSQLQQTSRCTKKASLLMNDLLERYRAVGPRSLATRLGAALPDQRVGRYTVNDTDTEGSFTITGTVSGEASELVGTSLTAGKRSTARFDGGVSWVGPAPSLDVSGPAAAGNSLLEGLQSLRASEEAAAPPGPEVESERDALVRSIAEAERRLLELRGRLLELEARALAAVVAWRASASLTADAVALRLTVEPRGEEGLDPTVQPAPAAAGADAQEPTLDVAGLTGPSPTLEERTLDVAALAGWSSGEVEVGDSAGPWPPPRT